MGNTENVRVRRGPKKIRSTSPARIIVFVIFVLYALALILPYLFGIMFSMKTAKEWFTTRVLDFPQSLNFVNYAEAWKNLNANDTSVPMMLINSIWYAGGMSFFSVILSSMSAYVVAKYRFPGRSVIYAFALVAMMIPIMGSLPAQLRYVKAVNALNSPVFSLVMCQTIGMIFVVMLSAFRGVSWEYAEAAFIDGAGPMHVFFRIMLPQVTSVAVAMFLTNFVALWADAETPLIFLDEMPTLSLGLLLYKGRVDANYVGTSMPVLYAGLIICMIPTVILFSIFQKSLMDIQMGGGLKG